MMNCWSSSPKSCAEVYLFFPTISFTHEKAAAIVGKPTVLMRRAMAW
jgi:hypothetical protein